MVAAKKQSTPPESGFKKWYKKNKADLNKRRREKYRKDPKLRKKILEGSRDWRKRMKKERKPVVRAPKTHFTIGEAAKMAGCSIEAIRNYEDRKFIPKTAKGGAHRKYTMVQVALIRNLAVFRSTMHYRDPKFAAGMKKILSVIKAGWKKEK
jgi:hypothetical protein